jgi:hypothetical protein
VLKSKPKHLRASIRLLSRLRGRWLFCWGLGGLWFRGDGGEFHGEGGEVFVGLYRCLVGGLK